MISIASSRRKIGSKIKKGNQIGEGGERKKKENKNKNKQNKINGLRRKGGTGKVLARQGPSPTTECPRKLIGRNNNGINNV